MIRPQRYNVQFVYIFHWRFDIRQLMLSVFYKTATVEDPRRFRGNIAHSGNIVAAQVRKDVYIWYHLVWYSGNTRRAPEVSQFNFVITAFLPSCTVSTICRCLSQAVTAVVMESYFTAVVRSNEYYTSACYCCWSYCAFINSRSEWSDCLIVRKG